MTMNRVLKTVLLYLLMALLPLSGMAAVRTSCGKVHAASVEASAHVPCDKASAAGANHQSTLKPDKTSHSHASANCSMCYVSSAAPLTATPVVLATTSQSVISHEPSTFAEFIPPGLDRPPR